MRYMYPTPIILKRVMMQQSISISRSKEDDITLFGFKKKEEKELFQKLILVKGIGCKTAIGILATGEIDAIN